MITGVTYGAGNLNSGNFTNVTWNGTDAIFTGTPSGNYDALGGRSVVFDVNMAVPEPSSYFMIGLGLIGFVLAGRARHRAAGRV